MKRYQCIKITRHELFEFKPGSIYDFLMNPGGKFYGYKTIGGRIIWLSSDVIMSNFQELLDLHVDDIPRDEAYPEPFTTPEPRRKLTAGWAWFIVLVITIACLIYKAYTE
jgi:hypothetical protein